MRIQIIMKFLIYHCQFSKRARSILYFKFDGDELSFQNRSYSTD